jgi:hypothetical protein
MGLGARPSQGLRLRLVLWKKKKIRVRKKRGKRAVILALLSDNYPADFRINQLKFSFSRVRFS